MVSIKKKYITDLLDEIEKEYQANLILTNKFQLIDGLTGDVLTHGARTTLAFLKGLFRNLEFKRA